MYTTNVTILDYVLFNRGSYNLSNQIHTIILILIGSIGIIILAIWGLFSFRDNMVTNTLQDDVKTSLYAARDNSARTERGLFIIDTSDFKKELAKHRVKEFDNQKLSPSDYHIDYLADPQTDVQTAAPYKAIKAVRVTVNMKAANVKNKKANANQHIATYVIQTYGKTNQRDKKPDISRDQHDSDLTRVAG